LVSVFVIAGWVFFEKYSQDHEYNRYLNLALSGDKNAQEGVRALALGGKADVVGLAETSDSSKYNFILLYEKKMIPETIVVQKDWVEFLNETDDKNGDPKLCYLTETQNGEYLLVGIEELNSDRVLNGGFKSGNSYKDSVFKLKLRDHLTDMGLMVQSDELPYEYFKALLAYKGDYDPEDMNLLSAKDEEGSYKVGLGMPYWKLAAGGDDYIKVYKRFMILFEEFHESEIIPSGTLGLSNSTSTEKISLKKRLIIKNIFRNTVGYLSALNSPHELDFK
jgi:hypothetical protein